MDIHSFDDVSDVASVLENAWFDLLMLCGTAPSLPAVNDGEGAWLLLPGSLSDVDTGLDDLETRGNLGDCVVTVEGAPLSSDVVEDSAVDDVKTVESVGVTEICEVLSSVFGMCVPLRKDSSRCGIIGYLLFESRLLSNLASIQQASVNRYRKNKNTNVALTLCIRRPIAFNNQRSSAASDQNSH